MIEVNGYVKINLLEIINTKSVNKNKSMITDWLLGIQALGYWIDFSKQLYVLNNKW